MKTQKMRFKEGDTVWVVSCGDGFQPTEINVYKCKIVHAFGCRYYVQIEGYEGDEGLWVIRECCAFPNERSAHLYLRAFAGLLEDREDKWCMEHAMFTGKATRTTTKQTKGEKETK